MRSPIDLLRGNPGSSHDLQTEMQNLQSRMSRLIDELVPWSSQPFRGADSTPRCEVSEDKQNFYFKLDMPGIEKENVHVELDDQTLTISAERREEKKEEGRKSFLSEVQYGSYSRSFALPGKVNEKTIEATFSNGVLSVKVPKTEAAQAKQIAVH